MSDARDSQLHKLNDCGCCDGIAAQTPVTVLNRPGLSSVAYRVGTRGQFLQTLIARLSHPSRPVLRGLTTRERDDFSIALLDAWSTVSDVLSFYQERIANESYLRTATEPRSLLELARLIGYELRPGVAASAYLAFTTDEVPNASRQLQATLGVPSETMIDVGTKAQSIPAPGEQPQTFETVEKIRARGEWNSMKPRLTKRHPVKGDADFLYFAGLATNLKKGDALLITPPGEDAYFHQVADVTIEDGRNRTRVELEALSTKASSAGIFVPTGGLKSAKASFVTKKYLQQTIGAADLSAAAQIEKFAVRDLFDNLIATRKPAPRVLVLRARASIFGHNAPQFSRLPASQRIGEYAPKPDAKEASFPPLVFTPGAFSGRETSWAEERLSKYPGDEGGKNIYLDAVYPNIVKGSWLVLKDANEARAFQVAETTEVTQSDFTLSAKVSRLTLDLTLDKKTYLSSFFIRATTVFAGSEELELARQPIDEPIAGDTLELDTFIEGLTTGQSVIICGELETTRGVSDCEHATISKVEQVLESEGFTRLVLNAPLKNAYVRETVSINANVALATNGETVREILGGGDASQVFQRFTLRQPPLTYTSSSAPSGRQTTLEVRVNDLLWHEVPTLDGHTAAERIYITRADDDGATFVQFGDGQTGARLPTGQENVGATYRKGTGLAGLIKANQLSQLMTRPLGVKAVINPLPASGAAAGETRDAARRNAPLTVLTLERVVSLRDYEDFASAFGGIGKALATWTWDGERRGVLLTVAGAGGAAIEDDSPLSKNLLKAMRAAGDPFVPLEIKNYSARLFRIAAKLSVHQDYLPEKVIPETEAKLRAAFSFDRRAFGQSVSLSEVIEVMQSVAGVVAVDIDALYLNGGLSLPNARLAAAAPRAGGREAFAAELLTLDPSPLDLKVMP